LFKLGELSEAESVFHQALALRGVNANGYRGEYAELLTNLALPEKFSGRFSEARKHLTEALRVASDFSPQDGPLMANIWANLGGVALAQKRFREASELYHKAADYWLKNGGPNHRSYAMMLSCLGGLEEKQGHHKRAGEFYDKALQVDETALGRDHPQVAADLINAAAELCFQKHCGEAIPLFKRAANIEEAAFGPTSVQTGQTWRQIGLAYAALKNYAEAEAAYQKAIRSFEAATANSSELISCLHEYAYLARKQAHFSEAERAEVEALGIQVRKAVKASKPGGADSRIPLQSFRSKQE
jgi:tetratricopeptide (TPR) repeat protein